MFKKSLALVALSVLTLSANAAHYVELQGPGSIIEGDTFSINIVGDFLSEGFIAGGVELSYDASKVTLDSYSTPLAIDSALSCPGAGGCPVDPPGTFSIVWGQFLTDLISPFAGPTLMGTATFSHSGVPGDLDFTLTDLSDFVGGWFGAGFITIDTPALRNISVEVSPVPIPAAAWLFGSALLGLAGIGRNRKKSA